MNNMQEYLDQKEWKEFIIEDLFDIKRGKRLIKSDQREGNKPYISSKGIENGVDNFIDNKGENIREFKDCLTIANSGSVGAVFYHPYKFVASDHVTKIERKNLSKYQYLFIAASLEKQIEDKYSFNREISDKRLKREKILLPVDDDAKPDWKFMHKFMKDIENQIRPEVSTIKFNKEKEIDLNKANWKPFFIEDEFDVFTGKNIDKEKLIEGKIPRITATEKNNGVALFTEHIDEEKFKVYKNFISVSFLGTVFYHPNKVSLDMKIHGLKPKNKTLNKYNALFLVTLLSDMASKYSYGYQLSMGTLKRQKIMLPVTEEGNTDWDFMEQCMKALETQKII